MNINVHPIRTAHPRFRPVATDPTLDRIEGRMRTAHESHMGYPYNLAFTSDDLARFGGYLINNLGDPYAGSHYASEVCDLEREAIAWFQRLWECDGLRGIGMADPAQHLLGAIGGSGSEAAGLQLGQGDALVVGEVAVAGPEDGPADGFGELSAAGLGRGTGRRAVAGVARPGDRVLRKPRTP